MTDFTVDKNLVHDWLAKEGFAFNNNTGPNAITRDQLYHACNQASQWGADKELEECLKLLKAKGYSDGFIDQFKQSRRPDPVMKVVNMLSACMNDHVGVELTYYECKEILKVIQDLNK